MNAIFHGSRPHQYSVGWRFLSEIMADKFYIERIRQVDIGYMDSNLLVLWKRSSPLVYENWHNTEIGNNRTPGLHKSIDVCDQEQK